MTIEELIAELKKIKEEHGNIEVKIRYREDSGAFYGYDDSVEPSVEHDTDGEFVFL